MTGLWSSIDANQQLAAAVFVLFLVGMCLAAFAGSLLGWWDE